jgi:D-alanyl-D-alanine carboxypeptidase
MRPDDKFRAGSIAKSFVSVVTLQLVEEGVLALDDPLLEVLPGSVVAKFPGSDQITVRMLLNHSSGIAEWLSPVVIEEIGRDPTKVWDVEEFLDLAAQEPPYFAPGAGYHYSNTDYNLLGLIIEEATGRSWRDEVTERVLVPLHLEDTLLPEPGDVSIPGNHAHGYAAVAGTVVDITAVDPSMAGAAGGGALLTTVSDLARFLDAVLSGELFEKAETLDEMLAFIDAPDEGGQVGYGLGMQRYLLPGGIEVIGHLGMTAGFTAFTGYLPAYDLSVAAAMNWQEDPTPVLLPALEVLAAEPSQ